MAIRDSWAVQASGPTGMLDVEEARVALGTLLTPHGNVVHSKSGFRPGPFAAGTVSATGTPDAFVHVSGFQLILSGGRSTVSGVYLSTVDSTVDINVLSTPADPTNPRNDLIVAQQSDTFYGDANSAFVIRQVVGTPAGVPADPTVTGSGDYVPLARVRVDAAATTIVSGKITDLRTSGHAKSLVGGLYSVALGGLLPVASKAERDALTGIYDGFAVWRQDNDAIQVYDGAGWRNFGSPGSLSVAAAQGTASTTYTDLATVGPTFTVETGAVVKLTITTGIYNSGANVSYAAVAVSGGTTRAAQDAESVQNGGTAGIRVAGVAVIGGLTPGNNTFTLKYRAAAGTANFFDRNLAIDVY